MNDIELFNEIKRIVQRDFQFHPDYSIRRKQMHEHVCEMLGMTYSAKFAKSHLLPAYADLGIKLGKLTGNRPVFRGVG